MTTTQKVTIQEFVERIPEDKRLRGFSWIIDNQVQGVIPAISGIQPVGRKMRILLYEQNDAWACTAEVPLRPEHGNEVYVRFSLLGFIALWNEGKKSCRINTADMQIELLQHVKKPCIHRHPSMMPMELRYEPRTNQFNRLIIYPNGLVGGQEIV